MRETSERNELWREVGTWVLENVMSKGTCWEPHLKKGVRFIWLERTLTHRRDMVRMAVRKADSDPVTRTWGTRKGEGPSFNKEVFPGAIKRIGSPPV